MLLSLVHGAGMISCQLSVVIPCYNYGLYLTEAIESALNQESSIDHMEVIIVNDASSDPETLDALSDWEGTDSRIQVIHHRDRLGAAAARNSGIAAAIGEWIAFLDADDVWTRGGLQVRWQAVQTYPDAHWLGADFVRWHEDGTLDKEGFFHTRNLPHQFLGQASEPDAVVQLTRPVSEFLQTSLGWTSTIMVRKTLLMSVGGFEARLGNYEDHHLWIRLARQTDFYFIPAVVAHYRLHPMSVSREEVPPAYWYIKAMHLLLQDSSFRPYQVFIRRKLALLYEQNAHYHRGRGETSLAIAAAANAVLRQPARIYGWKNLLAAAVGRR